MRALTAMIALTALGLAGCGDDGVGDPVSSHSSYLVESSFDVRSDFEDKGLGSVVNMLRDFSDHEDDPGRFVVDQIIERIPFPLDLAAKPLRGTLGKQVNSVIYALAPTAADEAKALADALSDTARKFAVDTKFEIGLDAEGRYTGTHTPERIAYSYKTLSLDVTAAELGDKIRPSVRIPVQIDESSGVLTFETHNLPLPLGTLMGKALDHVVLPSVFQKAVNLVDVIAGWFACAAVAAKIAESIGGESKILAACTSAASSVESKLRDKLASLDENTGLRLSGTATPAADGISFTGSGWSGEYGLGEEVEAPLDPTLCPFSAKKQ